jgi:hypothetical protein
MSKARQAERKMWSMPHHARIRLFQYPRYELATRGVKKIKRQAERMVLWRIAKRGYQ